MARAATKTERVRKTDTEKAQHALDVVQRKLDALVAKRDKLAQEQRNLGPQIVAAEKRRDYLASSPDLRVEDAPIDDDELPVDDSDATDADES